MSGKHDLMRRVRWRVGVRSCTALSVGLVAILVAATSPSVTYAHAGAPPAPHDIWHRWSWEPTILLGLLLGSWLYARALRTLWAQAGVGRGVACWQAGAFSGGIIALFVALISPLDAMGEALFSAHMVQHLVLTLVAAPLLVLGAPPTLFLWALPMQWRRQVARWWKKNRFLRALWQVLSHPLMAWTFYVGLLWLWHLPSLYQAALRNDVVHVTEHLCFLGSALLFWSVLLGPGGLNQRGSGAGILYVFAAGLQGSALGALLTFAPTPLYPLYAAYTELWGLSPLQDQQLAGLIMWIPPGSLYLFTALFLLAAWLKMAERTVQRRERLAGLTRAPVEQDLAARQK